MWGGEILEKRRRPNKAAWENGDKRGLVAGKKHGPSKREEGVSKDLIVPGKRDLSWAEAQRNCTKNEELTSTEVEVKGGG